MSNAPSALSPEYTQATELMMRFYNTRKQWLYMVERLNQRPFDLASLQLPTEDPISKACFEAHAEILEATLFYFKYKDWVAAQPEGKKP